MTAPEQTNTVPSIAEGTSLAARTELGRRAELAIRAADPPYILQAQCVGLYVDRYLAADSEPGALELFIHLVGEGVTAEHAGIAARAVCAEDCEALDEVMTDRRELTE